MPDPILTAGGVTYRVSSVTLVDTVDVVGQRGEVIAIPGPKGAGKLTFLHLLGGDLLADEDASLESDHRTIRSAMERTDTLHLASRVFATLSGGEQTRVVLLDEPTTALDVAHQERVLSEMRQLAAEDACVIAVLHDLNAAAFHADRIVLMDEGTVRAKGPPTEVLRAELVSDVYSQAMTVVEHPTAGARSS